MSPEKSIRERRKDETRTALLDAAAEVFARRGFEGASLDEICETAGYTRGAFYRHFADKEALIYALADRRWATAQNRFELELSNTTSLAELDTTEIARLFQEYEARDRESYAFHLELRLYGLRHPEMGERLAARSRARMQELVDLIREQLAGFGVAPTFDVETLGWIVISALDGFSETGHLNPDLDGLFAPFIDIVIKSILYDLEHPPEAPPPPSGAKAKRKAAPKKK